jgi:hypothetical protein
LPFVSIAAGTWDKECNCLWFVDEIINLKFPPWGQSARASSF